MRREGKVTAEPSLFEKAIAHFDAINRLDPNEEVFQGKVFPKEYLYALRMSACLARCSPNASEALRLAARCQHIARWEIPRGSYAMNRSGYLQWRTRLKQFHAEKASKVLRQLGYSPSVIAQLEALLLKKHLGHNPEMQTLEDVACLVFLEHYFVHFLKKHQGEKVIAIVRKTWQKMSSQGRHAALSLTLPPEASGLIKAALDR